MAEITVQTIDQILDVLVSQDTPHLDLGAVDFIDPYGLLLLALAIRHRSLNGSALRIRWPRSRRVRSWMDAMGFANQIDAFPKGPGNSLSSKSDALQPITAIAQEEKVSQLVNGFDHRLAERYPLTKESRNALVKVMLELFQNIPQHSNATGELSDPHGLAAMQDYTDSVFLVVADMGIGLRGSLALREEFARLNDKSALNKIVFDGMSRFSDPGRGGELRRIAQLVRKWDGIFAVRSGEALLYMDTERGDVYDAPFFPGVQIAVRLSRHVFGIEPSPVDNESFIGFNE